MSIRVMTRVWDVDLPDSEKLVLLALADCANDEGFCWPSMATLARKCSKSDRTVQKAVKSLCQRGQLSREARLGKGVHYFVHPRSDCSPEEPSPPNASAQTPEANDVNPRSGFGQTVSNRKSTVTSRARRAKRSRGKLSGWRFGDDWDF